MEFIFSLPMRSLFIFFTLRSDKKFESSSIFFSLLVALLLQSILIVCLVLPEKAKPCLQFSSTVWYCHFIPIQNKTI